MAEIKNTIGKRIHRLRRSKDMTQQCLAERIGVNASYIGPLEKGLKTPSIAVLQKLSEVLEQPIFSFFLEDANENNSDAGAKRLAALLATHPPDERQFILSMTEELSEMLRQRRN
ncbi:MAG TPA: XRE family transcriptional regulator [Phycisphaerales bacterium]|nr:XRE family transcriptional regulator [Phycisphaerales bacterium]